MHAGGHAADIPDPGIELGRLMPVRRAAVVAATHPLAAIATTGRRLAPTEFTDHIQIVAEDPSTLTDGRDFGVLSPLTWRVADNTTKLALILGGIGWGSLPIWMIEQDLADGRLVRVPAAALGPGGETTIDAIWRTGPTSPSVLPDARSGRRSSPSALGAWNDPDGSRSQTTRRRGAIIDT